MAKRFNEAVNIARQNFSTGEVQAKMDLVGRLEQFRAKQHQQNAMEAKERGVKSAAGVKLEKKDIDGQKVTVAPKKKAGNIFGLGEYETQAHNKALQGAYFASLDSDNRNAVDDITAKNKDNIAGFNDAIEGYRKGVLAGVDPEARQRVEIDLNGRIDSSRSKVHLATLARQKQESEDIINANAIEAGDAAYRHARNGDDLQAGEEYLRASESIDALDIPADKKQAAQRELRRELEENFKKNDLDVILETQGIDAAIDHLDELEKKVPKDWTPDEWESFIEGEQIDFNKKLNAKLRAAKAATEKAKKEVDFSAIEKRHAGDDTQIVDNKKLDAYYTERIAPVIADLPLEVRQASQAAFIDRMKKIPASLKAQVTNAVNSNNPDLLREAAMLVDRIDGIRGVVEQIPLDEQAYLTNVVGLLENMESGEAIDLARRATDPKDKPRIEAAKAKLGEIKNKPAFYRDKAQAAFDGGWLGAQTDMDEVSGAQLSKEYRAVYENAVLAGMSDADATLKADNTVSRLWGVDSTLGTKRVMKYPVGNYYAVNGDTLWVMKEAVKEANSMIAGGGVTADNIVLMANDETARTAILQEPTYAMKVLIDGSFHNLGQWKPDLNREKTRIRSLNTRAGALQRKIALEEKIRIDSIDTGIAP